MIISEVWQVRALEYFSLGWAHIFVDRLITLATNRLMLSHPIYFSQEALILETDEFVLPY